MKTDRRAKAGSPEAQKYANKRSLSQREADLVKFSDMITDGHTFAELAEWIRANRPYTLSIDQIKADMREVRARWKEAQQGSVSELVERETALSYRLQREASLAYERSRGERTTTRQDQHESTAEPEKGKSKGGTRKTKRIHVEKEGRDGDPRFLDIVLRCNEARRKLLGIDAPTKIAPTLPDGQPLTIEERRIHINAIMTEYFGVTAVLPSNSEEVHDEGGGAEEGLGEDD